MTSVIAKAIATVLALQEALAARMVRIRTRFAERMMDNIDE
jgi:hypothetical protein